MDAIRKPSVSERLALVEEIWAGLAQDPDLVPVSDQQRGEARRRPERHDADPSKADPWRGASAGLSAKRPDEHGGAHGSSPG